MMLVCLTPATTFAQDQSGQSQSGKLGPVGPGAPVQRKDNAPKGPAPKMPDGKPDFSGVWSPTNFIALWASLP